MINRRRFLQSIAAAAATPSLYSCQSSRWFDSTLQADPNRIIDIPREFSYTVVSRYGEAMSDGFVVPAMHDGMAAFAGENGNVILVRNHELKARYVQGSPFGDDYAALDESIKTRLYDRGADITPGLGGTTTTVYDPRTRSTEAQFLSLFGTEVNCAGGKTPWGSWLSCEESFEDPGIDLSVGYPEIHRDQRHGYVFEIPSSATELVDPVPLRDMGRFEHEAAAVDARTGIVYLTEDRWHSLFYRFIPLVPGQLSKGGRLQALAIEGQSSKKTHNWEMNDVVVGRAMRSHWIDLDDVDSDTNDLRIRGAAAGAATFARGEGITVADDRFAFACTIGGPARFGQVFSYKPSRYEGTEHEGDSPGELTLIAEANEDSLLKNCDNLTIAPWGDLILCEDAVSVKGQCALIGIRADGSQYVIANNAYTDSELAGVCFSPDGKTLFVNIQYPGMTVAITGPWPR